MNPSDERRGVPSASGMDRLMNCPASFEMERLAPYDEGNEDAASGTRIHAVLAGFAGEDTLSAAEQETCEMCEAQAHAVIAEWGRADTTDIICEQRLGLTALGTVLDVTPESRASFIFTGQADMIVITEDAALVIDYKTGRGDTPVAQDNPQLAALAVLVSKRYKVPSVRVAIVQPWAGRPTVADYSTNALVLAEGWLQESLMRAVTATPDDAKAGDWCKWCKAKLACPAYSLAVHKEVEVIDPMSIAGMDNETQRKAMFARAMELPSERLAASLRGLGMVKRFIAAIEGAARDRAENDAEFQQFYTLREKKGRRSISDVQTVANRAFAHGVSVENFTACCSITLGDTKELLKGATGVKGKALDAIVEAVLDGACDTGKPTKELVAVGMLEGGEA